MGMSIGLDACSSVISDLEERFNAFVAKERTGYRDRPQKELMKKMVEAGPRDTDSDRSLKRRLEVGEALSGPPTAMVRSGGAERRMDRQTDVLTRETGEQNDVGDTPSSVIFSPSRMNDGEECEVGTESEMQLEGMAEQQLRAPPGGGGSLLPTGGSASDKACGDLPPPRCSEGARGEPPPW